MIDPYTPRLHKHNGISAMREVRDGHAVTRVSWSPNLSLAAYGGRLFIHVDGKPSYLWEPSLSDLKARDWCSPMALYRFRQETSKTHVEY